MGGAGGRRGQRPASSSPRGPSLSHTLLHHPLLAGRPSPPPSLESFPGVSTHTHLVVRRVPAHGGFGLLRTNHKWAFIQAVLDSLIRAALSTPAPHVPTPTAAPGRTERGGWARYTSLRPAIGGG